MRAAADHDTTPAAPPPESEARLRRFVRQQRRREKFIRLERLSEQEVHDHIAWNFDPGPEYD